MKKTMFILYAISLFASCTNSQKKEHLESEIMSNLSDRRMDLYADMNDIVLFSDNTFLFYKHLTIDSLLAVWGNTKYDRVQYDTLPMFAIGPPQYEWSNDKVICLKQSCGTSCFFAYVMIFQTGEIRQYMYPMAYDATTSRIVYCPGDNPDVFLVVEDLLSGNKKEIIESYEPGIFSGHSIDSIKFIPDGLYVKWLDEASQIKEQIIVY